MVTSPYCGLVWKKANSKLSKTPGPGVIISTHSAVEVTEHYQLFLAGDHLYKSLQMLSEVILDLQ